MGPEAEEMGQSVLANQFITGLRPDLKSKVVGTEGGLDKLLLKAWFEEAKKRELAAVRPAAFQRKMPGSTEGGGGGGGNKHSLTTPAAKPPQTSSPGNSRTCYNCGMVGHLKNGCPYLKSSRKDREAHGRQPTTVANVQSEDQPLQEKIAQLKLELHAAELEAPAATIHQVMSENSSLGKKLGPTIMTKVLVNGSEALAMVDTGSPVSIVSLQFAIEALAKAKENHMPVEEWRK